MFSAKNGVDCATKHVKWTQYSAASTPPTEPRAAAMNSTKIHGKHIYICIGAYMWATVGLAVWSIKGDFMGIVKIGHKAQMMWKY